MTFRLTQLAKLSLVVLVTIGLSSVHGQRWDDGFGSTVVNPNSGNDFNDSGPVFNYYANTGVFTISNVGANGVIDSPDNTELLGDDYGLFSFLITAQSGPGSQAQSLLPTGLADGVLWNIFAYFNGKVQLAATTTPDGEFLPVQVDETPLFQLPSGLTAEAFQDANGQIKIETGIGFAVDQPGATLFSVGDPIASGAFNIIVPEPSSLTLLGSLSLFGLGFVRRRR